MTKKVIVNISSEAGSIGECWRDREFDYCMSKAALNMQSVLLQKYLKSEGIKVLAIHPGWMRTDMGGAEADISPDTSAGGRFIEHPPYQKLAYKVIEPKHPILEGIENFEMNEELYIFEIVLP